MSVQIKTAEIVGFPGYRVSTEGVIESCWLRRSQRMTGDWQELKGGITRGRRYVWLFDSARKRHLRYVHEIVLTTFVGPRPEGLEACHWNDNCLDNRLSNLRWDTRAANNVDKARNGKVFRGEDAGAAKLTAGEVQAIRSEYGNGQSMQQLAIRFGVGTTTVYHVIHRETWKHLA